MRVREKTEKERRRKRDSDSVTESERDGWRQKQRPGVASNLICSHDSMGVVPPPKTQTVKKTMRRVVVNIICRAYVAVSRIASANAMAPRRPATATASARRQAKKQTSWN